MYVTRPLSLYRTHPEFLAMHPSQIDGPSSGYLVLQDEDQGIESYNNLPFPQNRLFTIAYEYSTGGPGGTATKKYDAAFIPVINQPLSSNCYYVMAANNDEKGLAYRSATEKDNESCCFCYYDDIPNKDPEEFHPYNIYQQFEILKTREGRFSSRSIDPEGFPPDFLKKPRSIKLASKHCRFTLSEAEGLNTILRSQLPDFGFPVSNEYSQSKIVGKWHCPFMFVVEGTLKEQMERSMFYELTLEQQWERIYSCKKQDIKEGDCNSVGVSVVIPTESVKISWMDAVSERDEAKNMMWFWVMSEMGLQTRIGLSLVIVERMMWEQERVGWDRGNEKQVMVARMKRYTGGGAWREFGCYVLVERFMLKRFDGSLVLTYEFKHSHIIKCKWE